MTFEGNGQGIGVLEFEQLNICEFAYDEPVVLLMTELYAGFEDEK